MASVEEHYDDLLAQHYTWMRGDHDSLVSEYRSFFEQTGISPRSGGRALDLGAGSGFQSLALAKLGFGVLAVDTSETLVEELRTRAAGEGRVRPVLGDMRDRRVYTDDGPFEVAVCMGDTLTHLRSFEEVESLLGDVRMALELEGTLILEFRDSTAELQGADRIIPVRLDDDRIMATFLEYETERVNVHDIIFSREASGWEMRKSAYAKVRLRTGEILDVLEQNGFRVDEHNGDKGFTRIVARA